MYPLKGEKFKKHLCILKSKEKYIITIFLKKSGALEGNVRNEGQRSKRTCHSDEKECKENQMQLEI